MKQRMDRLVRDARPGWSRTDAERAIAAGRVSCNGRTVLRGDEKADPETDRITIDGAEAVARAARTYMMNKPAGVLSATEDRSCTTVLDLLPPELQKLGLSPAGRLDKDAEGLLILSADGALVHRIISPKSRVGKCYYLRLRDPAGPDYGERMEAGLVIDGGYRCLPARFRPGESPAEGYVTVCEGKFHQVKRMLQALGNEVIYLKRISVGKLTLPEDLAPGQVREIPEPEKVLF